MALSSDSDAQTSVELYLTPWKQWGIMPLEYPRKGIPRGILYTYKLKKHMQKKKVTG